MFKIQNLWLRNRKDKVKTSKIFLQKLLHLINLLLHLLLHSIATLCYFHEKSAQS